MAIPTGGLLPARRRRGRDGRAHDRADARSRRDRARLAPGDGVPPRGGGGAGGTLLVGRASPERRRSRAARGRGVTERRARAAARRHRFHGRLGRAAGHAGSARRAVREVRARARRVVREAGRGAAAARHRARLRRGRSSGCRRGVAEDDLVVVPRLLGRCRDLTASGRGAAGEIVCHGLAMRPGQADAPGRLRRRAARSGCGETRVRARRVPPRRRPAAAHAWRRERAAAGGDRAGTLSRDVPSAAGRLDVVRSACATAWPRRRASRLLGAARPTAGRGRRQCRCRSPTRACRPTRPGQRKCSY